MFGTKIIINPFIYLFNIYFLLCFNIYIYIYFLISIHFISLQFLVKREMHVTLKKTNTTCFMIKYTLEEIREFNERESYPSLFTYQKIIIYLLI